MSRRIWAYGVGLLAFAASILLGGCGFFPALNSTTGTAATSNSGDYAYTVNATTDTLASFSVSGGALTPIGMTVTLPSGYAPNAVVVSRQNTFVFTGGSGALYCFAISSTGTLTQNTTGTTTAAADYRYLATSPDGQWLLALDNENDDIYVFGINSSTCALTLEQTVAWAQNDPVLNTTQGLLPTPSSIRIAPSGDFVAVALGNVGDQLYAFDTSTGQLTYQSYVPTVTGTTDLAVQFDSTSSYLFVARGNNGLNGSTAASSVNVYPISTTAPLVQGQTIASGSQPDALEMDSTGAYLYSANKGSGSDNISGYAFASGTLTALTGSPYANGGAVAALVRDNSDKYILAAGITGTSSNAADDLTVYTLDAFSAGMLDATALAASGSSVGAVSIAATH